MRFAKRLDAVPPYLFAELERKIAEKRRAGVDVISLGIGDPDLPTPQPVVDALVAGRPRPGDAPVPDEPRLRRASARRRPASTATASASSSTRPPRSCPRSAARRPSATSRWRCSTRATSASRPIPATRPTPPGRVFAGAEVHYLPARGGERLPARPRRDPDEIALARANLLFLNYPNNPTGAIVAARLLRARGRVRARATT